MNDTYAKIAEKLSVRDVLFTQVGEYLIRKITRMMRCVEELKAPESPRDPMENA
jgi:hypothetical protein